MYVQEFKIENESILFIIEFISKLETHECLHFPLVSKKFQILFKFLC